MQLRAEIQAMIPLRDLNPTRRAPVMTIALIVVNFLVFLNESNLDPRRYQQFVLQYGLVPARLLNDLTLAQAVTLVTSMFVHSGWLHILSNMLYLWIFGNNIEDRLGMVRFTIFYLISGLAAAATQIAINPASRLPMIGASGAIAGVLGAYVVLYPRARVQTLVFIFIFIDLIEMPAVILLGWWFLLQLLNAALTLGVYQQGGVAFFAHIGGFVAGVVLIRLFEIGRRRSLG